MAFNIFYCLSFQAYIQLISWFKKNEIYGKINLKVVSIPLERVILQIKFWSHFIVQCLRL